MSGGTCALSNAQDVRCLRVVLADVFFVTKDTFGRVPKVGGTVMARLDVGSDYKSCAASSNGNTIYSTDPTAGTIYANSTSLPMGMIPPRIVMTSNEPGVQVVASALPWIYWTAGDLVRGCNLSMGCSKINIASNVWQPNQVVVDGSTLFFATTGGSPEIRTVPTMGGANNLVVATGGTVRSLIVSGSDLFYAAAGAIMRVDKSGMGSMALATGRPEPLGLVSDITSVYWAEGGSTGGVVRAMRNNNPMPTVLNSFDTPVTLDVDPTHVYVGAKGGIFRIPKQ
jgi:hypothetical protein